MPIQNRRILPSALLLQARQKRLHPTSRRLLLRMLKLPRVDTPRSGIIRWHAAQLGLPNTGRGFFSLANLNTIKGVSLLNHREITSRKDGGGDGGRGERELFQARTTHQQDLSLHLRCTCDPRRHDLGPPTTRAEVPAHRSLDSRVMDHGRA